MLRRARAAVFQNNDTEDRLFRPSFDSTEQRFRYIENIVVAMCGQDGAVERIVWVRK